MTSAFRNALAALALVLAPLVLALSPASAYAQAEGKVAAATAAVEAVVANTVAIDNFVFTPPELTIKAGTTVTWKNDDDIPHVVLAKEHQFRSKALDTGDAYSFTFSVPGRFDYFCALHPHMVGAIVVVP
jgi:plastocyanin